jgi:hypothetical protein
LTLYVRAQRAHGRNNLEQGENMKRSVATIVSVTLALYGCATSSKDIASSYVSPLTYQSYDCDELIAESQRIQARVQELGGRLDEASSNDKVITTVGVILFWPILFVLGGTKQQEAEYARLRGEYDALQQAAIAKKCSGATPVPAAPVTPTSAPERPVATPQKL